MHARRIIDPDRDWESIDTARIENFCQSSAPSFAWVNPEGVVYLLSEVPYEDHIDWATSYIDDVIIPSGVYVDPDARPDKILIDVGWIKVTAATLLSVNSRVTTHTAWESVIDMITKCPNMDPNTTRVHIQDRGRSVGGPGGLELSDFLALYGTRQIISKFYDKAFLRLRESGLRHLRDYIRLALLT